MTRKSGYKKKKKKNALFKVRFLGLYSNPNPNTRSNPYPNPNPYSNPFH